MNKESLPKYLVVLQSLLSDSRYAYLHESRCVLKTLKTDLNIFSLFLFDLDWKLKVLKDQS